jgi:hypothetical protein
MTTQTDLADMDKLWSDLLQDALDSSQRRKVLNQVASDLKAAVEQRPDWAMLLEKLGRLFGERRLSAEMWPAAERAFSLAYGPAALRLISWLVSDDTEMEQRLDEISSMLDVRSEMLLRDILTRHSEDLVWSYFAWSFGAEDEWRDLNFTTFQAVGGNGYFVELKLKKVNGEMIVFELRPNQMLIIGRAILTVLNQFPTTVYTQPDSIELFLEQAQSIVDALSASLGMSQEQTPAGGTDGLTPDEITKSPSDDGVGE